MNKETHQRDIEELNAKIAEQEETKRMLVIELERLLHDLRQFQSAQGVGHKEPIVAEIARMEELLREKKRVNKVLNSQEIRINLNN